LGKKKKKDSTERHTWHIHRVAFVDTTTTELSTLIQEMQKITEQFEKKIINRLNLLFWNSNLVLMAVKQRKTMN